MKVTLLRTLETQRAYEKHMQIKKSTCFMCDYNAPIIADCWKIIPNQFPYDAIAEKHDMLVLASHGNTLGFTEEESLKIMKDFLFKIQGYDAIIENAPANRSVPGHYHLHLIKYKTV